MTPGKSISNPEDLARSNGMGQRIKNILATGLSLGGWENGISLKISSWGRQFADPEDTFDVKYFGW